MRPRKAPRRTDLDGTSHMTVFSKLKQFKDLRSKAKSLQHLLAQETVHADAKGGKVQVVMDGNQKIIALDIDSSLLAPEKKGDVEEGVQEAVGSALTKAQRVMAEKIKSSNIQLPGLQQ